MGTVTNSGALLVGRHAAKKGGEQEVASSNQVIARLAIRQMSDTERLELLHEHAQAAGLRPDRIVKRAHVGEIYGVTTRAVDLWAQRGLLQKVRLPGSTRAVGFRESEVLALMNGGAK